MQLPEVPGPPAGGGLVTPGRRTQGAGSFTAPSWRRRRHITGHCGSPSWPPMGPGKRGRPSGPNCMSGACGRGGGRRQRGPGRGGGGERGLGRARTSSLMMASGGCPHACISCSRATIPSKLFGDVSYNLFGGKAYPVPGAAPPGPGLLPRPLSAASSVTSNLPTAITSPRGHRLAFDLPGLTHDARSAASARRPC